MYKPRLRAVVLCSLKGLIQERFIDDVDNDAVMTTWT